MESNHAHPLPDRMADPPHGALGFDHLRVTDVSKPRRELLCALLLYKSLFIGDWFRALTAAEPPVTRRTLTGITRETQGEAEAAFELVKTWDRFGDAAPAEPVTVQVLTRLLEDLLAVKERSTEVFLAVGLNAPTNELRNDFVALADLDRRHADMLRELLNARAGGVGVERRRARAGTTCPVRGGPFREGALGSALDEEVRDLEQHGNPPARIILSDLAMRRLRDEGHFQGGCSEFRGVPVDVDLAWTGACFAVTTRERVNLAEIMTAMHTREHPRAQPPDETRVPQ